jgi:catechol 2,3-dioxygenase-like lactoylglutathione lyase family enzyme
MAAMKPVAWLVTGIVLGASMTALVAQGRQPTAAGGDIRTVNHVAIRVDDFDAAMRFYTQTMGFRETFRFTNPRLAYVQVSRDTFLEITPAAPSRPAGVDHFGLEVAGLDAAHARMKGVPQTTVTDIRVGGSKTRVATITDPFGIRFEMLELGPESLIGQARDAWR